MVLMEGTDRAGRRPVSSGRFCSRSERSCRTLIMASFSRSLAYKARILVWMDLTVWSWTEGYTCNITLKMFVTQLWINRKIPILHLLMSVIRRWQDSIEAVIGRVPGRMVNDGCIPATKMQNTLQSCTEGQNSFLWKNFLLSLTSGQQQWLQRPLQTGASCSPPGTSVPSGWCQPPKPGYAPLSPLGAAAKRWHSDWTWKCWLPAALETATENRQDKWLVKKSTQPVHQVLKMSEDLPAVPSGSSAPAPVGCEASFLEPPFSRMRPEAGLKHFAASPPSPRMPSSYAALPPAVCSGSEQTPKPALAPRDADTTPLRKLSDTATHARAAPVLADAPHLNIQRETENMWPISIP